MTEIFKQAHRRWFDEVLNHGRFDLVDEIFAPGHVLHFPASVDLPPDYPGVKGLMRMYRTAFPNARFAVEDQVAENDRTVTRFSAVGRHDGPLGPVAPTGRYARITGVEIARFADGRIVEIWELIDMFAALLQLGAIPPPGATPPPSAPPT